MNIVRLFASVSVSVFLSLGSLFGEKDLGFALVVEFVMTVLIFASPVTASVILEVFCKFIEEFIGD